MGWGRVERYCHMGMSYLTSLNPQLTLGLNTRPCRQTFGCGTPHEQWQKSGLHSSGPGKRPSEGQVWSLQPAIGCNVDASDVVEVSGAFVASVVVVVSVEDISGVVVVSADVVFVILS